MASFLHHKRVAGNRNPNRAIEGHFALFFGPGFRILDQRGLPVMDRVTTVIRSKIMASVRSSNTGTELAVRRLVHGLGYRYSLIRKDLPGKPDLTFVSRHKVIFVHGCFWHGHSCRYGRLPKSKLSFWKPKILGNKLRDRLQVKLLKKEGWSVMIIWQCALKNERILAQKIGKFLDG